MRWKRLLLGEWNWKRPFKSLAFIYGALAITALGFSDHFIFHPPVSQYTPSFPPLVMLKTAEGTDLAAVWYPPARPDGPVLLWSHGNAEDIGGLAPLHEELAALGYGILAYDYPGYGLSPGSPGEAACYAAIEAAWQELTGARQIDPAKVIIVGQSIGSGPACWLAEREHCGGLVLVSPFLSAFRTVTRIPLFPGDRFPNIHRIGKIEEPLLVAHGTDDVTIPFAQGRALHDLHRGPKQFLPIQGADHNTIWPVGYEEIEAALLRFAPLNR